MSIKIKIWLAALSLSIVSLSVNFLALWQVHRLADASQLVLKDNYASLQYMNRIQVLSTHFDNADSVAHAVSVAKLELQNITEPGEKELGDALLAALQAQTPDQARVLPLTAAIQNLNLEAIDAKSEANVKISEQALNLLLGLATMVILLVAIFLANFPDSILTPILDVTARLKMAAQGHYQHTTFVTDGYEMGELARSFNALIDELNQFRKSNLAALLYETTRYEAILQLIQDPIIILDHETRLVFINEVGSIAYGFPSQGQKKTAADLATQSDLFKHHWGAMVKQLPASAPKPIEVWVKGSIRWYVQEGLTIEGTDPRNGVKKVMGHILRLVDVTTFSQVEQDKNNFLAIVSHELKTPLSAIRLSSTLLEKHVTSEHGVALLNHLNTEAKRMSKLINNILSMSKLQLQGPMSSKVEIKLDQFVNEWLDKAALDHQNVVYQREHDVHGHPDNSRPLSLNTESLELVLNNLLNNAAKHGDNNYPIMIRTGNCKVSISNTINDTAEQEPSSGEFVSGIGLTVARQVASRNGWAIKLEESNKLVTYHLLLESEPS